MAANTAAIFTLTPVSKTASVSTATTDNPLRSGTGNAFATILSAGVNGTRIDRIVATATATTVACQLLLFIFDGTTNWFFKEFTLAAIAASTTTAGATTELIRTDGLPVVILPSGYSLKCCLSLSTTSGVVNVTAYGGDF